VDDVFVDHVDTLPTGCVGVMLFGLGNTTMVKTNSSSPSAPSSSLPKSLKRKNRDDDNDNDTMTTKLLLKRMLAMQR
jgi:hypothetical protein